METSNYHIGPLIDKGGMATVYEGTHKTLGHKVAIKVLNPEFRIQENIRKRFLEEARRLARMSHPNLVKVSDSIEEGDIVAFVMEFVEGENLRKHLQKVPKLKDNEIASFLGQMVNALGFVHQNGLVHRDIKPSNFMVSDSGQIKLLDFGIAKSMDQSPSDYTQTGTGIQMGTPMYMSPEQVHGAKNLNEKSDQYSLGVVLWEMVTGRKPYDADTISGFQIQSKIVNETLPLTGTHWDEVIQKATSKDPEKRFASLSDMIPSRIGTPSDEADKTVLSDNGPTEEKMQVFENSMAIDLRDNRERAKKVITAFWFLLGITAITVISNIFQYSFIEEVNSGDNSRKYLSELNEDRAAILNLLSFSFNFFCAILFIKWYRRLYENVFKITEKYNIKHEKNTALWAWIIPIINLFRPYLLTKEICNVLNRKISKSEYKISSRLLIFWWILFLVIQISEYFIWLEIFGLFNLLKSIDKIYLVKLSFIPLGFTILAIVSTILLVRKISKAEADVFKFYKVPISGRIKDYFGFWVVIVSLVLLTIGGLFDNYHSAQIAGDVQLGSEAYNRSEFGTAYSVFSKEDVCDDKIAQYYLGLMNLNGQGVSQDYELAKKWFEKSAEQDDPDAQNNLGDLYQSGYASGGIRKLAEAFKWYLKSAQQENAEGQYNVAKCFLNAEGVDYDSLEAFRYSKLSADQNFTKAMNNLGWMYANGRCVEKNLTESFNYYLKSAQLGDANGQRELAMCYWNATGVENNFPEAEKWLRLAVQQGDPDAHWFLGMLLFNGLTGPANQQEALDLLYKAVDLGVYGAADFLTQKGYQAAVKAP
jgi:TPR repeat protein/serine/threonine protein kinase